MGYIFPWMNKHKPKPDPQKEVDEAVAKEKATPVGIIQAPKEADIDRIAAKLYQKQLQPSYKEKKVTFTKLYMVLIGLLYLAGAMLGAFLVLWASSLDAEAGRPIDPQMFIAYAGYLAGPTAVAIGFYAWKSKAENLLKIKNSLENHSKIQIEPLTDANQRVLDTLANMKGEYV